MRVSLLGPVGVTVDGDERPVGGFRRKAVLAVLGLRAGEVVGTDVLADVIWGTAAPPTAANALQVHVSYLRQILGDRAAILTRPPGYVLNVAGDATDVAVAERLIAAGTTTTDPGDRVARRVGSAVLV